MKRLLGSKLGNLVFALDALKGFVAAFWPLVFFANPNLAILGLIAAILGHSFSVFLKFRGERALRRRWVDFWRSCRSFYWLDYLFWVICFYTTKVVALASILFAISLPVTGTLAYGVGDPRFVLALLLCVLIVVRHRTNIARLREGKENSFKKS